ncbi:putative Zn-binding protein involved in type VI secretion [Pseudoduganella flava]|uniref:PAAR domain-containing protein n=1 Tax=Pseudoduganella flava TaxID=871742 RepID=A0A562PCE4_9BURK|nr:PAAR domain-containing protein [Pseudoduganella flava]QGZ40141.1 PAAR domain-containing protein [Pseudoduganella flava]TWI42091.1 putative Zn-binding protein involved in type VI secretion [Pseudoduganella flava]
MKNVIRLGDPTSHGGKVMSVIATHFKVGGKAVALLGDKCVCPMPGHGVCTIVEGSDSHTIDGVPVAYHGHKTSCGATLISTCAEFSSD